MDNNLKNILNDLLEEYKSNRKYSDNTYQHEYCNGAYDAIERVLIILGEKPSTSNLENSTEINF